MVEDIACCEAGHIFCKDCVRKGCEVVIGQGKLHFPCLEMCDSYFSLQILQVSSISIHNANIIIFNVFHTILLSIIHTSMISRLF